MGFPYTQPGRNTDPLRSKTAARVHSGFSPAAEIPHLAGSWDRSERVCRVGRPGLSRRG
jgi:hypothetical protein